MAEPLTSDDVRELQALTAAWVEGDADFADIDDPALMDTVTWARTAARDAVSHENLGDRDAWVMLALIAALDGDDVLAWILWELDGPGFADSECPTCNRTFEVVSDERGGYIAYRDGKPVPPVPAPADSTPYRSISVDAPAWNTRIEPLIALTRTRPALAAAISGLRGSITCPYCELPCGLGAALCTGRD